MREESVKKKDKATWHKERVRGVGMSEIGSGRGKERLSERVRPRPPVSPLGTMTSPCLPLPALGRFPAKMADITRAFPPKLAVMAVLWVPQRRNPRQTRRLPWHLLGVAT